MTVDRVTPGELIPLDLDRATLARSGRREGREVRFLCPAHEDTHPSARWRPEKRVWFCDACKSGGTWRDLAERLGLLERRENGQAAEGADVAAIYPYRDAAGRLMYEVVRKQPKAFACRRPDGQDRWIWNLQGVERVLYRLPEVIAAVARGEWVFVVEDGMDSSCDFRAASMCQSRRWEPKGGVHHAVYDHRC